MPSSFVPAAAASLRGLLKVDPLYSGNISNADGIELANRTISVNQLPLACASLAGQRGSTSTSTNEDSSQLVVDKAVADGIALDDFSLTDPNLSYAISALEALRSQPKHKDTRSTDIAVLAVEYAAVFVQMTS